MKNPVACLLLLASLVISGCVSTTPSTASNGILPPPVEGATHALAGATEPVGLEAPLFALGKRVLKTTGGEPGVAAALDGTLYLTMPGCDLQGEPAVTDATAGSTCRHGLVYRSDDAGSTWKRLNKGTDGRLMDDNKSFANGDAEVAIDSVGNVYSSNLGAGIKVLMSADRGETWSYLGNATPDGHWADRQWMAAAGDGHLIVTWMGGAESELRQVAINSTFDGGKTWTGIVYLGDNIGWLGQVQFEPSGERAFIPFTQPLDMATVPMDPTGLGGFLLARTYGLFVARTQDGGLTWDVVDTGARVPAPATGLHWSGTLMAPALDVTGDGHVVYAWSEDVPDPAKVTSTAAKVRLVSSADWGATWTKPLDVSTRMSAIQPWVTGGAGDRVAITYYASDTPLDTDMVGVWDVMATIVDGVGSSSPKIVTSTVAEKIHVGGICSRGGLCLANDRNFLDYFESDLMPDGRLVVAFPTDPPEGGKTVHIFVAMQSGGTPLSIRG
ncbi:MAG: hypothetical protein HY556_06695 [Euryarchaeota archaeon]|nr:hypothetical protein [Euryarchaeota archaeon]